MDEQSEKRPKEEKKQELQRTQEEGQGDESFKNWLSGLHRRRQVSGVMVTRKAPTELRSNLAAAILIVFMSDSRSSMSQEVVYKLTQCSNYVRNLVFWLHNTLR